ncbi:MAG: leucyl/phenylalanyl-tRNA--protein transferase [Rhodobacteraceae bacterium HLUCCA08]|nr:MAG: leucyl/phenylalanyl-tRNA--protein transferase [Rhodobacteraceae bacterium HLUCCA08]
MQPKLVPETLLAAYAAGIFPMAEHRFDDALFWVDPRMRGVIPLDGFHISRKLARRIRRADFTISFDRSFAGVVQACADREETWINGQLFALYDQLHADGDAHSVEVWTGDRLVGGVFGICIGGAFFGESMFSRQSDASKVALAYLVDRLRLGGFVLFDTQFLTPHLASLGAVEIPRAAYRRQLRAALAVPADFDRQGAVPSGQDVVQRNAQTS